MRTKGATSNVLVSLKKLNQLLNPDAMIPIARRFANQIGIRGKAMIATDENLMAAGNQPAIEEKIAITELVEPLALDSAGDETPMDVDGSGA